jgi:hypothetical protein
MQCRFDSQQKPALARGLLLASLVGLLTGCQVGLRAPNLLLRDSIPASSATEDASGVSDAFNARIVKLPGFTLAVSGSYAPPASTVWAQAGRYSRENAETLSVDDNLSLKIFPSPSCSSPSALDAMKRALARVTSNETKWPAKVSVEVRYVDGNRGISWYSFALAKGREARLRYVMRCGAGDSGLLKAVTLALHEAVHAALDLAGHQPKNLVQAEWLAHGAEACFMLNLSLESDIPGNDIEVLNTLWSTSGLPDRSRSMRGACREFREYLSRLPIS